MHQHARQNTRQTQSSGIESCQQPIWQRHTSISTTALKMTQTSISLLTFSKDDRIRDAYIACIRICPRWSQLYNAPEGKKGVSKDNGFLYKKNEKGEWRLVLPSTFNMNGKNYLEDAIKEAHDATAHGGVEKTLKWLTDKFICQPFSRLVKESVASCDTCQRTKYSNKPPLGQVTILHVPARAWSDITMDFLKISVHHESSFPLTASPRTASAIGFSSQPTSPNWFLPPTPILASPPITR